MEPVPDRGRMSLYMVVLLVSIALALSLTYGAPGPTTPSAPPSTAQSQLPATAPGLTRDEGVFLFTAADDGSQAAYFIAQNTRHSIWPSDVQLEQQLNPLWPTRSATRDDVLAFAEGAPIGGARTGLIVLEVPAEATADATVQDETPSPVVDDVPVAVEDAPGAVVDTETPVADEIPMPAASAAAASPMPHAPVGTPAKPADFIVLPAASQSPVDLSPTTVEPTMYVLQSGDNLIHLSARFGTTVAAILDANQITNPNRVFVGQSLIIPAPAPKPDVVESPTAPAPVAETLPDEPVADSPTAEVATTYTVKAGDSAITIARKLGVDVEQLLTTNAVFNRNRVYVGQVLTIPGA